MNWKCCNCGEELGETTATGRLKIIVRRRRSYVNGYLVGFPVTTSCPNCGEINEVGSMYDVCGSQLPSPQAEMPSVGQVCDDEGEDVCCEDSNGIKTLFKPSSTVV